MTRSVDFDFEGVLLPSPVSEDSPKKRSQFPKKFGGYGNFLFSNSPNRRAWQARCLSELEERNRREKMQETGKPKWTEEEALRRGRSWEEWEAWE